MSKNSSSILDKGGNQILNVILNPDNSFPESLVPFTNGAGNCIDLGHIKSSGLSTKADKQEFKSEDGIVRKTDYDYSGTTFSILMETDKDKLDWLAYAIRGKQVLEIKYQGIKNAKYQEVFRIVNVTPQINVESPGGAGSLKYESTASVQSSDVQFTAQNLTDIETALDITIRTMGPVIIPADREHEIVETVIS
jgi:hypothetical protein